MSLVGPQPAVICTIIAKNYLPQARCLAESFYAHHPDGQMFVLLVDQPDGCFEPAAELFTIVRMAELALPQADLAFRYTVLELSTAVKPFFLEYLLDHGGLDNVIYLDPDIYCYRPLTPLLDVLRTHMVALTPHLLEPLDDQYRPNELDILRVGAYNLGCIGVARTPDTRRFLRWWQRHLERDCVVDLGRGLFVDQGWIDLAPSLFDGVAIVRDPSCNVAYWNLAQRHVTAAAGGWRVNEQPLTFYHFSGLDVEDIEHISVHQNRFTLAQLPELRPLVQHYRDRLLAHGYATGRHWQYGFGCFDNGVAIPQLVRHLWRDNAGEQRWPSPFETASPDSFFQWLNQEADQPTDDGQVLSNLALAVYRQRVDLQKAFPDVLGAHRSAYIDWFVHDPTLRLQLDEALIQPLQPAHVRLKTEQHHSRRQPRGAAARLDALLRPLPEEPLAGKASLSRRVYYGIRNPLRRLGLHQPLKRLIGIERASRILETLVLQEAVSLPVTRQLQPRATVFSAAPEPARGLNLVGYLRHTSGVGEVARALLHTLEGAGYPVVGIETPSGENAQPAAQAGPYACNLLCVNADMTPLVQRALGAAFFEQRYTIGFWHWETTTFPAEWHDHSALLNEIWVASDFVRDTLATLIPIPLHTIRVPVTISRPALVHRADLGLPEQGFVWLFAFDMHSYVARKNPHAVVEAYRRAFGSGAGRTQLVVKVQHLDAYPGAAARLRADIAAVGGTLISRSMTRGELAMLYAACDGYVSLHRCEGFGLTIAEAMALGKPVVATGYSGNMDFMTAANSYPVRYHLIKLERDHGPYRRGTYWAEPDLDHAAELMRRVFEQHDEARQKGLAAAADMERHYGSHPAGQRVIARLMHIEGRV